jgi:hypothetical protein
MITCRSHDAGELRSHAVYSPDEKYRYALGRSWVRGPGKVVTFIMLNPSTATEKDNDPTVERCQRRAKSMGFVGFWVGNIFALRSTDPRALYKDPDPIGQLNTSVLTFLSRCSDMIVCAWGNRGNHLGRSAQVKDLLVKNGAKCYHLGLTKTGEPRHPLYLSYDVRPQEWAIQCPNPH